MIREWVEMANGWMMMMILVCPSSIIVIRRIILKPFIGNYIARSGNDDWCKQYAINSERFPGIRINAEMKLLTKGF